MADYPPFMNAYGNVPEILDTIKEAKTPDRFITDFLGTNLGFTGGSARPFIPLAKRLGQLGGDGTPTAPGVSEYGIVGRCDGSGDPYRRCGPIRTK
jgi:hypothetical protein